MYLDYYQLDTKPFQITVDPKFLWLGDKHREALATLRYGIMDNRGFLLLTGEVGTGKTILINRLITMLDIGTVVATIPDPDLVSMDFYNLLADGFKMNRTFDSKSAFLIHLRDFLHQSYEDQKQVLLIIDESQRLNHQLMEDIRVLSNIELHDRKLINVFFVGQQEFNNILMTPQNRALAQRITVRYHIEPLDEAETDKYIRHRLKLSGGKGSPFKPSALPEIYAFSGGIPRLINIICDHALLTGFSKNKKEIDAAILRECAEDLKIPVNKPNEDHTFLAAVPPVKAAGRQHDGAAAQPTTWDGDVGIQPLEPVSDLHQASPSLPHTTAWRAVFGVVILILIGLVAFALIQINQSKEPRWDSEELTPKKYLTTLEKEKEKLASRLAEGNHGMADSGSPAVGTEPARGADSPLPEPAGTSSTPAVASPGKGEQAGFLETEIAPLPLMKEKTAIHFALNSNEIESSSFEVLDRIAEYLKNHPAEIVYVRGYTDASGSPGYNESVSRFRASAVKSYLLGKGAPDGNIRIFAMGAHNPIAPNDTANGRSLNRRVEIEFPLNEADRQ